MHATRHQCPDRPVKGPAPLGKGQLNLPRSSDGPAGVRLQRAHRPTGHLRSRGRRKHDAGSVKGAKQAHTAVNRPAQARAQVIQAAAQRERTVLTVQC